MSSFKRRVPANAHSLPAATRPSALSPFYPLLSTGVPSLDDVLGGGLPLSTSLLLASPDLHSAWGLLLQKYFVAQGLWSGQTVCVVGTKEEVEELVTGCMWVAFPADNKSAISTDGPAAEEADDDPGSEQGGIKIAWRYERMKRFNTTVPGPSQSSALDNFCAPFDLTCQIPPSVVASARRNGQLVTIEVATDGDHDLDSILRNVTEVVREGGYRTTTSATRRPLRLSLPFLFSTISGSNSSALSRLPRFFHALRPHIRSSLTAALITLPPHLCTSPPNLIPILSHLSDAAITLLSDPLNPIPGHHGLAQVKKLPGLHSLVSPSERLSTLRGLGHVAAHGESSGGGENNLAFTCKRKNFMIETLHLNVEGGVSDRRTEPGALASVDLSGEIRTGHGKAQSEIVPWTDGITGRVAGMSLSETISAVQVDQPRPKKLKRVGFRQEESDLYDF